MYPRRDILKSTLLTAIVSQLTGCGKTKVSTPEKKLVYSAKPAPNFATAKNVIFLFMAGAPSQIDLFDPKPALKKWDGKLVPAAEVKEIGQASFEKTSTFWSSPFKFDRTGQSGIEISELLPYTQQIADDICLIRSMKSDTVNHHPGQHLLMTGVTKFGHPTMGAWINFALESESPVLPGYVVLSSGQGTAAGSNNWSSGFLPSRYRGVTLRSGASPVLYLQNPPGVDPQLQAQSIELIQQLNQHYHERTGHPETLERSQSYQQALELQSAAPELTDLKHETEATLKMYGLKHQNHDCFGRNCLLARRLIERGVRFIQLNHASWDAHERLIPNLKDNCAQVDQGSAALVQDLKQRGLLDETIVIWAGEFGRTSTAEVRYSSDIQEIGRDHHADGFSLWMAGGGFSAGKVWGSTDELGLHIQEQPVHIHDLQATILHTLGIDHEALTFKHEGRDHRLTDIGGNVIPDLLS